MLCGTDPFPELFRAKRYKLHHKFLSKMEFQFIMRNLPVAVAEDDIENMFAVADVDKDGKISYKVEQVKIKLIIIQHEYSQEFQAMINPPQPPQHPKPTKAQLVSSFLPSSSYNSNATS